MDRTSGSAGFAAATVARSAAESSLPPSARSYAASLDRVGQLPFELTPARAAELLANDEAELVDVREPHEREAGHIPGSRHVELGSLADAGGELPTDRPLIFQCRVGSRSAMAAFAFRRAGFDAHNLDGGIVAWADCGLPIEGRIAEH